MGVDASRLDGLQDDSDRRVNATGGASVRRQVVSTAFETIRSASRQHDDRSVDVARQMVSTALELSRAVSRQRERAARRRGATYCLGCPRDDSTVAHQGAAARVRRDVSPHPQRRKGRPKTTWRL